MLLPATPSPELKRSNMGTKVELVVLSGQHPVHALCSAERPVSVQQQLRIQSMPPVQLRNELKHSVSSCAHAQETSSMSFGSKFLFSPAGSAQIPAMAAPTHGLAM